MRLTAKQVTWLKVCLHLAGLLPFLWLVWAINHGGLGADPVKDIQHFIAYSNLVNHLRERKQEFRYGELEADTRAHGYLSTGKEIFLNPAIHIDLLLHFTSYLKDKQTQDARNKDATQSKPSLSGKKIQSRNTSAGLAGDTVCQAKEQVR